MLPLLTLAQAFVVTIVGGGNGLGEELVNLARRRGYQPVIYCGPETELPLTSALTDLSGCGLRFESSVPVETDALVFLMADTSPETVETLLADMETEPPVQFVHEHGNRTARQILDVCVGRVA